MPPLPDTTPHNRVTVTEEELQDAFAALRSGKWAQGERVEAMEQALCHITGRSHAVGVASGVSALRLSLLALGIGPGDAVIVPAYSCVALANAVLACSARPILADVGADHWNLTADTVAAAITPECKAVIAVHSFGQPANISSLRSFKLPVIEDCAHGLGPAAPGVTPLGGQGDIAVTSFYATKFIGAGEGGAILTDREDVAAFARNHRDYSDQPADGLKLNDKMTDIEAALALARLKRLGEIISRRQVLAERYLARLKKIPGFRLPAHGEPRLWYRFAVELNGVFPASSAEPAIAALAKHGVGAAEPVHDWRRSELRAAHPVSSRAYARLLSLPLYPSLAEEEVDTVCAALGSLEKGMAA